MSYEEKIERGLKLWLKEEIGVTALTASIGESEVEKGWGGCETCGYGGSEDEFYTPIYYTTAEKKYGSEYRIEGRTSLSMLPELLSYIDRAN